MFLSNGASYSHVCGRINALQKGNVDAFFNSVDSPRLGLEDAYVGGVSVTHGTAGSRQHVWTFAAVLYETDPNFVHTRNVCPCTNTNINWSYQIPSFIGNSYFCESGNPGPGYNVNKVFTDDPLWDGDGCGLTSTCCQLNNPPWFCTTLPQPTTDDIELRICGAEAKSNEDIYVQLVDVYNYAM